MEQGFTLLFAVNFLRTLIIIFLVYYGFIFFRKYILPYLLVKAAQKLSEKMQNGGFANQAQQNQNRRPKGDIVVEGKRTKKDSNSKKSSKSDDGDYVDFEEIK